MPPSHGGGGSPASRRRLGVSGAFLTHAGRRRSSRGCRPHPHVGWRSWRAAVPTPVVSRLLTHAERRRSAAGCRPHPHVGSRSWRAAVPSPVGGPFSVGCCSPISPLLTVGTWVIASAPGARHSVPPANHQAADGATPAISNLAPCPRTGARCCTDPSPVRRTPPRWSTHHSRRAAGRHIAWANRPCYPLPRRAGSESARGLLVVS